MLDDSDETVPVRPLYAESLIASYRFGGRPAYALTTDGARLLRDGEDRLVPLDGADLPNPTPVVQNASALSAELDRLLDRPAPAPAAALSTIDAELFAQLGILMAATDLPETVATALPADQTALVDPVAQLRLVGIAPQALRPGGRQGRDLRAGKAFDVQHQAAGQRVAGQVGRDGAGSDAVRLGQLLRRPVRAPEEEIQRKAQQRRRLAVGQSALLSEACQHFSDYGFHLKGVPAEHWA